MTWTSFPAWAEPSSLSLRVVSFHTWSAPITEALPTPSCSCPFPARLSKNQSDSTGCRLCRLPNLHCRFGNGPLCVLWSSLSVSLFACHMDPSSLPSVDGTEGPASANKGITQNALNLSTARPRLVLIYNRQSGHKSSAYESFLVAPPRKAQLPSLPGPECGSRVMKSLNWGPYIMGSIMGGIPIIGCDGATPLDRALGKPPRSPQVPQRLVAMCKVWGPSFVLGPGTHPQQDLWKGKIISQSSNTHVDRISQSS